MCKFFCFLLPVLANKDEYIAYELARQWIYFFGAEHLCRSSTTGCNNGHLITEKARTAHLRRTWLRPCYVSRTSRFRVINCFDRIALQCFSPLRVLIDWTQRSSNHNAQCSLLNDRQSRTSMGRYVQHDNAGRVKNGNEK